MEERVEGAHRSAAAEGGDPVEGAARARRHAGAAVEGDDAAEEGLVGDDARVGEEPVEDRLHLREHARLAELAHDEVVGARGVAEGFGGRRARWWGGITVRVRVEEEGEGEGGVLLEAEEGGEAEGGDGGEFRHWCEGKKRGEYNM